MRCLYVCIALISVMFAGYNPLPFPDLKLLTELRAFIKQVNEVEVADSMNGVDPGWVLGSIVNIETGQVRGLDN
jgi:hypothetical protein